MLVPSRSVRSCRREAFATSDTPVPEALFRAVSGPWRTTQSPSTGVSRVRLFPGARRFRVRVPASLTRDTLPLLPEESTPRGTTDRMSSSVRNCEVDTPVPSWCLRTTSRRTGSWPRVTKPGSGSGTSFALRSLSWTSPVGPHLARTSPVTALLTVIVSEASGSPGAAPRMMLPVPVVMFAPAWAPRRTLSVPVEICDPDPSPRATLVISRQEMYLGIPRFPFFVPVILAGVVALIGLVLLPLWAFRSMHPCPFCS